MQVGLDLLVLIYFFVYCPVIPLPYFSIPGQTSTPVGYVGKMLEGFKLSSTPLIQKKDFPPPSLPRNFRPVHVFKKPDEENQSGVGPPGGTRGQPQFTDAMSRGVALGEQPFVGKLVSFELYSMNLWHQIKFVL